jgi:hypothetical protein
VNYVRASDEVVEPAQRRLTNDIKRKRSGLGGWVGGRRDQHDIVSTVDQLARSQLAQSLETADHGRERPGVDEDSQALAMGLRFRRA